MTGKSTRFITDIKRIIKITLAWTVIGILLSFFDYVTTSASYFYIRTENYRLIDHIITNVGGALMGGILGGSFIIFFGNRKLRERSFGSYVLINGFSILIIDVVLSYLVCIGIYSLNLNERIFSPVVFDGAIHFLFNIHVIRTMAFWFVVTIVTSAIMRISEKYGPGILWAILFGKYHKPRDEKRIFMFLDIRSSTSIAEQLGHNKYFQLLKKFFSDITDTILYRKGEIYQYVGDEVVISWKIKNGLKNNNCLNCFFEAKKDIEEKSDRYIEKYGIVPEFKAGIHLGTVTVGEIGVIKKEIAFSGDVLNTTSRIQNECNKYNADLLVSEELLCELNIDSGILVEKIDEIELKGKQKRVKLYSLSVTDENN